MYSERDLTYKHARAIRLGERHLPPEHQVIVDALAALLEVRPLDFGLDTKETSRGYRQQVVDVIVERVADAKRLDTRTNARAVAERFLACFGAGIPPLGDATKAKVHAFVDGTFPEIMVGFHALEDVETAIANRRLDVDAIRRRFERDIVDIITNSDTHRVVWFASNAELEAAHERGLTTEITNAFVAAIKQHDELGYFGPHSVNVTFDTRQSLDESSEGKEWMYFR